MSNEGQDQREEGGWGKEPGRKSLNYSSRFPLQDGCLRLRIRNR
jgi:hypothetical protein